MDVAFVSPNGTATAGNASGGDLVITKPSGVLDNYTMVVSLYSEFSSTAWTLPTGWAWWMGPTGQDIIVGATPSAWIFSAWKTASSEPASWTFVHGGTAWRIGAFATFSGAFTGGDPEDSTGPTGNSGIISDDAPILLSVITNSANDMLIGTSANFSGADLSAGASGMTLAVQLGGCGIVYELQAAAGASGTKTLSLSANSEWSTILQAIKGAVAATSSRSKLTLLGVS